MELGHHCFHLAPDPPSTPQLSDPMGNPSRTQRLTSAISSTCWDGQLKSGLPREGEPQPRFALLHPRFAPSHSRGPGDTFPAHFHSLRLALYETLGQTDMKRWQVLTIPQSAQGDNLLSRQTDHRSLLHAIN